MSARIDDTDPVARKKVDELITRSEAIRARADAVPARLLPTGTFNDTDIANARRIALSHGASVNYTVESGWLVWDGRRWAEDSKDVRIQAIAKQCMEAIFDEIREAPERDKMMAHAKRSQSRSSIENAIALLRSEPGILAELTDFDADPWLLNVLNGTLDLRTAELRPHERKDRITKLASIRYDASATCPEWEAFLRRITNKSEGLYDYLRRFVGYLLTGVTSEQVLHFLFGIGANGKTVFCEVVAALLDEYAIIVSPEMVMARRHGGIPNDIARLRGARSALMNETSQGSRFDEAKLKDLTGGDTLNARFLHREFFNFRPTHKLVIRGNHRPAIRGTDEGIWRRLRLLPFTVQIPEHEQDRRLGEKLRDELPGILRWAVEGCVEWQRGGLRPPDCVMEAVRAYREESDTLGRFIGECCEVLPLGDVRSSDFYRLYREFAERAGERAMPSKDLPAEMQRRGFEWKRTKSGILYLGIRLLVAEGERWAD